MAIEESEKGVAIAPVEVAVEHLNRHGAVEEAVLFAMVDTVLGAATMSVLDGQHLCASIDVQVRSCGAASMVSW
ncbi:MAG TPA: hypothetical protein VFR87_11015 [Nocardioidaceae bacterium]|nr:hypothetical protein [Nocardioidaceae bacterium]